MKERLETVLAENGEEVRAGEKNKLDRPGDRQQVSVVYDAVFEGGEIGARHFKRKTLPWRDKARDDRERPKPVRHAGNVQGRRSQSSLRKNLTLNSGMRIQRP